MTGSRGQCRICAHSLSAKPILEFDGMPCAAQRLPLASELEQDRGAHLAIHQCEGCGLLQVLGEPVPYYREVIRAAGLSLEMGEFRRSQFSVFIGENGLKGRPFLEVGCGRGEYLRILRDCGVAATGLEYASEAVRECQAQGLNVVEGYLDRSDQLIEGGPFQGFAVFNFMEHWPDPNATLAGIRNNLAPGGVGLIEVPNFEMILAKGIFTEFIADHLFYYNRATFLTTLGVNGFEVIDCKSVWHDYILSATVRKRPLFDVSGLSRARESIEKQVRDFLKDQGSTGVAVWGAGHQALAVIALLGVAGSVRYVVDSAPFKQGRFTPASHIPIFAPEMLRSNPVGAVIVIAAAYSDEIVHILRSNYRLPMRVAVLRDWGLEVLA